MAASHVIISKLWVRILQFACVLQKRKDVKQKADEELSQAERHRRRAAKKRVHKRKDAEREAAAGIAAHPKGIKSAREDAAAEKEARAARKRAKKGGAGKDATSGAVFRKLHEERNSGDSKANHKAVPSANVKSSELLM